MSSEYERIAGILGEERSAALDKGAWAEKDAQVEAVKHLTDDQLKEIVGDLSEEDIEKWSSLRHKMIDLRVEAMRELRWRPIVKRANEALDRPGSSGVYCVTHDGDFKECPPGAHNDD